MEIEAKFRATARIKSKDIEAVDISPYLIGKRHRHNLRDTLLDTDEYAIRAAKHTLRVRYDNKMGLLTLKGGKTVQGAIHSRSEIEVPLGGGDPTAPATWESTIVEPVAAIIGTAPLQRLMTIHNRRKTWDVFHNGEIVGEIALDRGTITAGSATTDFHEVEVELKEGGTETHLEQVVARLTAALPLVAESQSKAQRAWALWERVYMVGDALKHAAERTPMSATAPLAEAARSVLATHVLKLYESLPIAKKGDDPEGVHQARVATRRLRAVLAELGGVVYEPHRVQQMRRGLRAIARTLGVVRDADVFLLALDKKAEGEPPEFREELQPLYAMIEAQRAEGRATMLTKLKGKKHTALIEQVVAFVTTVGADVFIPNHDENTVPPTQVRDFAGSILWTRYEAVQAYESHLATADLATLHQLRIEVKRLRYVLDLFEGALDKDFKKLKTICADAQEHLGALNDTAVGLERLDNAPYSPAMAAYSAALLEEQRTLYAATPQALSDLLGLPFRRALSTALAKL